LLGIYWAFDNLAFLYLKKRQMSFELEDLRVVAPLDLEEGDRYVEPVREDLDNIEYDHFYKVIAQQEDYINPIADGKLSSSNSNDVLENRQHKMYEVSTRK
jgi:hypothetical protein